LSGPDTASTELARAFLEAVHDLPAGTFLALGPEAAGLHAEVVDDRPGWRGVGVVVGRPAVGRPAGRPSAVSDRRAGLRAGSAALPLRAGVFDAVLADHVPERLVTAGPTAVELARVCRPGGCVLLALEGRRHQAELRDLVTEAAGIGVAWTAGRCTYEDAMEGALAPGIEVLRGQLHRDELVARSIGPVMTAIQLLRAQVEPRLRSFVNWTMVLARSREALERELREHGEWCTATEIGVVVARPRAVGWSTTPSPTVGSSVQ